jgi:ferredoxin/flavodoxin
MIGIWYFSGTGKCRQLAEETATRISDSEVEIRDITPYSVRKGFNNFVNYNKLIIIFPVYGGDIPFGLKDFFNNLNGNGVITILIALWGNVHSGKALSNAGDYLKKHNFRVVAGAEILAEHSYSFGDTRLAGGRPTEQETAEIISFIKRNLDCTDDSATFSPSKEPFDIALLMLLPQSFVPRKAIKMMLDREKCLLCNLCQSKCPVNAIMNDMSIDNGKCIRCLSCESACPVKARSHKFTTKIGKIFFAKHQYHRNENRFFEHVKRK